MGLTEALTEVIEIRNRAGNIARAVEMVEESLIYGVPSRVPDDVRRAVEMIRTMLSYQHSSKDIKIQVPPPRDRKLVARKVKVTPMSEEVREIEVAKITVAASGPRIVVHGAGREVLEIPLYASGSTVLETYAALRTWEENIEVLRYVRQKLEEMSNVTAIKALERVKELATALEVISRAT